MRLKEGSTAINFSTIDINGDEISLQQYSGRKILLSFFRYASCPVCNLRIHELITHYEKLNKQDLQVIAIFQSPNHVLLKYAGKQQAPFPMIGNPDKELYKLYKTETSFLSMIISLTLKCGDLMQAMAKGYMPGKIDGQINANPVDFLIDEQQRIVKAHYGKNWGDHIPMDQLFEFAE